MIRNSLELEKSMRMHNEHEINTLAEEKIKLEMEWEEQLKSEDRAKISEPNEATLISDVDKVSLV